MSADLGFCLQNDYIVSGGALNSTHSLADLGCGLGCTPTLCVAQRRCGFTVWLVTLCLLF